MGNSPLTSSAIHQLQSTHLSIEHHSFSISMIQSTRNQNPKYERETSSSTTYTHADQKSWTEIKPEKKTTTTNHSKNKQTECMQQRQKQNARRKIVYLKIKPRIFTTHQTEIPTKLIPTQTSCPFIHYRTTDLPNINSRVRPKHQFTISQRNGRSYRRKNS